MARRPWEAIVLIGFGGPEGPADVLPFLRRVTEGKNIPDERLIEVGGHYDHFGGVSPINGFHRDLLARWRPVVEQRWPGLRVYWGNRNSPPFVGDALEELRADGSATALAVATSAFSSYSSCRQYQQDVAVAAEQLGEAPRVLKAHPFFDHPLMVDMWSDRVRAGLESLPAGSRTLVLFATHSLPQSAADAAGPGGAGAYVAQHLQLARAVMARVDAEREWDLCFQSRSGPPQQPWLEPDVSDRLAEAAQAGAEAVVLVPLGFVSDHIEVLWDLDTVAMADGRAAGLAMVRVPTVGQDERFLEVLTDLVAEYLDGTPFPSFRAQGPLPPCPADCCLPVRRAARSGSMAL